MFLPVFKTLNLKGILQNKLKKKMKKKNKPLEFIGQQLYQQNIAVVQ